MWAVGTACPAQPTFKGAAHDKRGSAAAAPLWCTSITTSVSLPASSVDLAVCAASSPRHRQWVHPHRTLSGCRTAAPARHCSTSGGMHVCRAHRRSFRAAQCTHPARAKPHPNSMHIFMIDARSLSDLRNLICSDGTALKTGQQVAQNIPYSTGTAVAFSSCSVAGHPATHTPAPHPLAARATASGCWRDGLLDRRIEPHLHGRHGPYGTCELTPCCLLPMYSHCL